ncbi:MAG: PhoH family protein [Myxococcales bacterium]|nr:PhoH family protein [Myxococcales bacterium]
MRKVFVLDTNVLLHDPRAIFKFDEHEVVIPIHVIEEVDHFKRDMNELGRNARMVARYLDRLREKAEDTLQRGVDLDSGGRLRVAVPQNNLRGSNGSSTDNKILRVALATRDEDPDAPTVFVTMDSNLRIRADAHGLRAENYEGGRIPEDQLYTGLVRVTTTGAFVDQLGKGHEIPIDALDTGTRDHPNACILLADEANDKHTALGRVDPRQQVVRPLRTPRKGAWGVRPRNVEQSFALDLLLDDDLQLVTLVGRAGTGKTLLAVAAGLQRVVGEGAFARLLVSRPIFPLGRDIGYLPGTLEEKLNPWMQPVFDNLEYIFTTGGRLDAGRSYAELLASGTIQIEPLTYIRGRTLPHQFLIVDEAQNLTPHEVKTIVTRCGQNTKIVLTGDPEQIDNPYVDAASNGLTTVAERFKHEGIGAHITLSRGERSELAERASELL